MDIKFVYPNPVQRDIIEELEKITEILSKEPSPQLKKNMRFVRNFTYSLLMNGKRYSEEKTVVKTPLIKKDVVKIHDIKKPVIAEIKKVMPKVEKIVPLPPVPPPLMKKVLSIEEENQGLIKENGVLRYKAVEPFMSTEDWEVFNRVKDVLNEDIIKNASILENEVFVSEKIKKACEEIKIKFSKDAIKKIIYYLKKNILGYGKMEPLIREKKVKAIVCNSYNDVKVDYENTILKTEVEFDSNEDLNNFLLNLAEKLGKKLEEGKEVELSSNDFKVRINYNPIMGSSFTLNKL